MGAIAIVTPFLVTCALESWSWKRRTSGIRVTVVGSRQTVIGYYGNKQRNLDHNNWLKQISHAARPIRSTTQMWEVTRPQYRISVLVSQSSFGGETSGSVSKCRLYSQAK